MSEALTIGKFYAPAANDVEPPLPANIEAEAALIGAILIENSLIDMAADKLAPEDFYEPLHQRIFAAIVAEAGRGRKVTPATLKPYFDADETMKQLGGSGYLFRLTSDPHGLMAARELVDQIAELKVRRGMVEGLRSAVASCLDLNTSLTEIVAEADAALDARTEDPIVQVSAAEAVDGLIRGLKDKRSGVQCHAIPELDRVLGPIHPKDLVILAARPGMGKTAVAISYAIGAAKAGHGALFISLEMSSDQIGGRMAADWCFTHGENSVPYAAIAAGNLNEWQSSRLAQACGSMVNLPLQIVDTGQLALGRLNAMVKRWKRRFAARGDKLELVVVDYLQLMRAGPKGLSKYEDVSEVSNGLKRIAKEHEIGVLALCQLSREVEKRPDKRPILADLRDSGSIEQDADSVLFLLRQEYYLEQMRPDGESPKFPEWQDQMQVVEGKIEFIAAKRRNGRIGTGTGAFHGAYQAVR